MATQEQLEAFIKIVNTQFQDHVNFTNAELAKTNQQLVTLNKTIGKTITEAVAFALQNILPLSQAQAKSIPQQPTNPLQALLTPEVPKSTIEKFDGNPTKYATWKFQIEQVNLIYHLVGVDYIAFMA
jgi:hypothetical protein